MKNRDEVELHFSSRIKFKSLKAYKKYRNNVYRLDCPFFLYRKCGYDLSLCSLAINYSITLVTKILFSLSSWTQKKIILVSLGATATASMPTYDDFSFDDGTRLFTFYGHFQFQHTPSTHDIESLILPRCSLKPFQVYFCFSSLSPYFKCHRQFSFNYVTINNVSWERAGSEEQFSNEEVGVRSISSKNKTEWKLLTKCK
jgi:hypothetical protein